MPRSWLLAAACIGLVLLSGCLAQGADPPEGEIPFDTLDQGQQSGIQEQRTQTVQDQDAWEALYQEHAPDEDPPDVDFEERIVVAIFKGQSPDGCHGAHILNVSGTSDETIRVKGEFFEITDSFCTEAITYPFHIVTIDRYDADIRYDIAHTKRQAENQ